ncbi:Clavaminate synthase-like protein [Gonapodya prolifera JEL478]|uniref:Clavaminate synthase-like protein n=1 Tax=Gonapodya prolifera (strain JEL478) TaxID=1344416 RepID=A0A139ABD9_GONPJ|nr:Clavaminate synthase-like protein [Gonapodya prolifera JEL478]|eukprot:KXS13989.1 Clavaminate synthase-like protein [Gonapodya prolifera JEL478]
MSPVATSDETPTSPVAANVEAESPEWAALPIIDISNRSEWSDERRLEVARQIVDAARNEGFFMLTGHGVKEEDVQRAYEINDTFFDLSIDEKMKYLVDQDAGTYIGYTPAGLRVGGRMEMYNFPAFNRGFDSTPHPSVFKSDPATWRFLSEFSRGAHEVTLFLLELMAVTLDVPSSEGGQDWFRVRHDYDGPNGSLLRMMRYPALSASQDASKNNLRLGGHTDFGTLTVMFSPKIPALQILAPEGEWRYVKPVEGALVCNVGDTLQFLTAGYLKSTQHRVTRPRFPQDAEKDRANVIYFLRPNDDVPLIPLPSPQVKPATGVTESTDPPMTAADWVRARVKFGFKKNNDTGRNAWQDRINKDQGVQMRDEDYAYSRANE